MIKANELLKDYLLNTLRRIGLPIDFKLTLRGYSKTYEGRYYVDRKEIVLYHLDPRGELLDIENLMATLIHEVIHHFQWYHDKSFKRVRGVMHNTEFMRLENLYNLKYKIKDIA